MGKSQKTKYIIILVIIISLLIIFVLYNYNSYNGITLKEEDCEAKNTGEDKTICYTMLGIESKDIQICENLKSEYDIDFCYIHIIEEVGLSFDDCDNFEGTYQDECMGYMALLLVSSGECEIQEREASKKLCFELSAKYINKAGFCEKVDDTHKNLCDDYLEEGEIKKENGKKTFE